MKSVRSCDIDAPKIAGENKLALLPALPPEPAYKKNPSQKPPSEKQLMTALKICKDKGIPPDAVAKQYGASKLGELDSSQIWKFINQNIKPK
jgi:hypothetical protein